MSFFLLFLNALVIIGLFVYKIFQSQKAGLHDYEEDPYSYSSEENIDDFALDGEETQY